MPHVRPLLATSLLGLVAAAATASSRPAVVVTIENSAPENGTFQTPLWIGFHDGSFDSYDGGSPASSLPIPGSDAIERLAEDGSTGPISADFAALQPDGVQATVVSNGPIPPIGPGQVVSRLFEVDPSFHRYFSYASMVIPSNDAFIANGDPLAHRLFNDHGRFVGAPITVPGTAVNDAGTEVNDELPMNTAFFGQAMPNTGDPEGGVITPHPGFLPIGSGGILDDPMFANADFLAPGYENLRVRFDFIDLARPARFAAGLSAAAEVQDPPVASDGFGMSFFRLRGHGTRIDFFVLAIGLTGDVQSAHLHLAPVGQNGPVVVPLTDDIINIGPITLIAGHIRADDVVGPLAGTDAPFDALVAEMVGGGIYVNLHTKQFPAGELRGQVGRP